jgi:hypothetical protein
VKSIALVKDGATEKSVKQTEKFLVFRSGLKVNTDGAPDSYHPIGTSKGARNVITNGIAVYPASGRYKGLRITSKTTEASFKKNNLPPLPQGQKPLTAEQSQQIILDVFRASRDANYAIPATGTIDWYAIPQEPGSPTAGFYRPCIQTSGPYAGFFVAQTAKAADPTKSVCDPAHWMNSNEIPYITLPGKTPVFAKAKAKVGDLALIHRKIAGSDRWIVAIAADTGNTGELGEGSIALHVALGNPPEKKIPGNLPPDVTTFLFPGSAPSGPVTTAMLSDESLIARLETKAGGRAVLEDCLY